MSIIREQYGTNGIGRWAVVKKDTGEFIGWAGLKLITFEINGHKDFYDVGYRFIKRHWGKGYATEAAIASVQYAWNELKVAQVYAHANVENAGSRRVLEKAGMQFCGTFVYENEEQAWYHQLAP